LGCIGRSLVIGATILPRRAPNASQFRSRPTPRPARRQPSSITKVGERIDEGLYFRLSGLSSRPRLE
jgi:hypothetical protein